MGDCAHVCPCALKVAALCGHTDGHRVAAPALVIKAWVLARVFAPALWCSRTHDGDGRQSAYRMKTSFFARAHRSRKAPLAVMELRLCIACLSSRSGMRAEREARVAAVIVKRSH